MKISVSMLAVIVFICVIFFKVRGSYDQRNSNVPSSKDTTLPTIHDIEKTQEYEQNQQAEKASVSSPLSQIIDEKRGQKETLILEQYKGWEASLVGAKKEDLKEDQEVTVRYKWVSKDDPKAADMIPTVNEGITAKFEGNTIYDGMIGEDSLELRHDGDTYSIVERDQKGTESFLSVSKEVFDALTEAKETKQLQVRITHNMCHLINKENLLEISNDVYRFLANRFVAVRVLPGDKGQFYGYIEVKKKVVKMGRFELALRQLFF